MTGHSHYRHCTQPGQALDFRREGAYGFTGHHLSAEHPFVKPEALKDFRFQTAGRCIHHLRCRGHGVFRNHVAGQQERQSIRQEQDFFSSGKHRRFGAT